MFLSPRIARNRIAPWLATGVLMLFLVGCSGAKTTDGQNGAPTQESAEEQASADGSGKKMTKAEKEKSEEARKIEDERKAEEERLAEEKRLAEKRRLVEERERGEAEKRRLAEEKYRAGQVRQTLGEVQPPPPPPPTGPPAPVVDRFGDTKIFVRSGVLEAAGPLDRPAVRPRREPGIQSARMGGSGTGNMTGNMAGNLSDSSVQRDGRTAAEAQRRDGMPRTDANTVIGLTPFERAVPPLPREPVLRVAVLSDAEQPEKADWVALIIGDYSREALENRLGMMVKIAYVAQVQRNITRQSEIRYRPKFFRAAVTIAKVLPRDQALSPMTASELSQRDVDLVVYIGRDYR